MISNIQKKIQELTNQLDQANYEYYHLNKTTLSDNQYDALLKELIFLEKQYPHYKLSYSPTFKIGGFVSSKFSKMPHRIPMLSLDNVFNLKELKTFCDRLLKKNVPFNFITELKIDGIAINLKYEKGILVQALTRGDGSVGELVTENIKTIKDIPLRLKENIDLEVRGEIFFDYAAFQALNKEKEEQNEPLFSNPRNAASGTLRQLNSSIVAKRNLSSFIYSIIAPPDFIQTQEEVLNFLKKIGFSVNPYHFNVTSFEELKEKISEYEKLKNQLSYGVDGIVIKVQTLKLYPSIGNTTKFPKWAISYKFSSLKSETIIQKINFHIGRTGVITPVAHLLPVIIDGSLISKVTLHNYDYIQKKDIRINDFVLVHKSGSIIPQILNVVKEKRTTQIPFQMISHCPGCHRLLDKKPNEVDYFCLNENCEEKQINKIIHFVSNEAMNIQYLGKKTLITLFRMGLIKNISDLYSLKDQYDKLKELPNFKDKKISKILDSIEKSKTQSLDKILFGLGINNVGIKIAKLLKLHFRNIHNLKKVSLKELFEIHEIGDEIANNIYDFFQKKENIQEIDLLSQKGIFFDIPENNFVTKNNLFQNKKIVLTGVFKNYSRKELTNILEKYGAFVLNNVSSKIDYLIHGSDYGSKFEKASLLKIKIMNENELYPILESLKRI
ncbi:NAD-dependent DNA ligase LigA ['Camptotheca acuminata' phytoplasma]|uniref:NAD-dependent DNA ligase LigA n=1 Tax='Camptotheca acuminata' phytoplasma TaxID=3239192 RepID=UPI00351A30DA